MKNNNNNIKKAFQQNIENNLFKNIFIRVIPALIILIFFVYHDIFVINVLYSAILRMLIIIPLTLIIFIKIFYSENKKIIYILYTIMLTLLPLMMYGKIIIHFNTPNLLYSSILGAILVIFIVSLDLRVNIKYLLLIYLVPFLLFVIALHLYNHKIYMIILNIFPIVFLGIIANILYNKLLFNQFKYSFLLEKEKEVVEEQNEELKVLNNTKNKFFSIISHDLKNPFNIVMGFSEILNDSYDSYSDKERKHYISEINNSSTIVYNLLDNLLQWSSIQINGISIKKEPVNLKKIINEIISTQELNAKAKNIKITSFISEDIVIEIDKYSVYTVIGNLIGNAVKFSFEKNEIIVNADIQDNQIVISVKDFGVGMQKNIADKLFRIDENLSTLGTKNEKGNGLGLVLCKEIAEQNNGEIWVESILKKGSTFFFSLPI